MTFSRLLTESWTLLTFLSINMLCNVYQTITVVLYCCLLQHILGCFQNEIAPFSLGYDNQDLTAKYKREKRTISACN